MKIMTRLFFVLISIFMLYLGLREYPSANLGTFIITICGAIVFLYCIVTFEFSNKKKQGIKNEQKN